MCLKRFGENKKRIIGLGIIAILAVGLYFYYETSYGIRLWPDDKTSKPDDNGAMIKIIPGSYDFGTIKYGEKSSQNFEIKNTGNETLQLLRVSTSCGCTKAEVENNAKSVEPGESVKMTVTIDPSVHRNYSDVGDIKRIIYINTNDKNSPETELEVIAKVIKPEKNTTVKISVKDYTFDPKEIKANEGEYVELKFSGADNKYDFYLEGFGISENIEIGKESSVVFLADKKGVFSFTCKVCERNDKMNGILIIQ